MLLTTETGSVYEVNTDSKKIRRLNGSADPTPRQGKDGDWKSYIHIYPNPIKFGEEILISWGGDLPPTPETINSFLILGEPPPAMVACGCTLTSRIVKIEL